jgi:hypothetical protein
VGVHILLVWDAVSSSNRTAQPNKLHNLIPFITGVIHQDNQGQCRELLLLEAMIDKRNSFEENPRPIFKPQTNQ